MRSKNLLKVLIASLVVFAAAALSWLLPIIAGRPSHNRAIETLLRRQGILHSFDLLDAAEAQKWRFSLPKELDSAGINRQIAALLRGKNTNVVRVDVFISSEGLFTDAWGTPFSFAIENSDVYLTLSPDLRLPPSRPFAVWSAGANRRDELGFGDDLPTGQSHERPNAKIR